MKRKLVSVIAIILVGFVMTTTAFAGQVINFSDVKATDWFKPYVDIMSEKGISEGYGNGKYGPQDNLQVDQLIKMVVVGMGYNPEACETDKYWACKYIKQAKELGLVKEGEFTDYQRKITRGEIARIVARGMTETFPSNLEEYKSLIKDYNSIPAEYQQYVLKVYSKGIVNGYPNGNFGVKDNATRAEASKMIVCFIDPSKRVLPNLQNPDVKTEVIRGYTIPVERTVAIDVSSEKADLGIVILMDKDLSIQYKEAQDVLQSKFGSALAQEIIDYTKGKKDPDTDLSVKTFTADKYKIDAKGYGWSITITVKKN